MGAYFVYRISTAYDGFYPSKLPERTRRRQLAYNWGAYVESLEPGDIVLTYFTGGGCARGVYAVAEVRSIDLSKNTGNVIGRLLHYSASDRHPLIPVRGNEDLFRRINRRQRGAEIVVPEHLEQAVYSLVSRVDGVVSEARVRNITLPGAEPQDTRDLRSVPTINPITQLSPALLERRIAAAYWIRPSQSSWMGHPPEWLPFITRLFSRFKAGDFTRLDGMARELARQLASQIPDFVRRFGVVLSVPLNESKRQRGELDRAGSLARLVADRLGLPYAEAFTLEGNVSRRRYKNAGLSDATFRRDYRRNLTVRKARPLSDCVEGGREILLLDDVYTDGVTTGTIVEALRESFTGAEVRVRVATLGVMAKLRNMDEDLANRWR